MAGVKGKSGRFKKGSKLNSKSTILKTKPILKSKSDQNKPISEPKSDLKQNDFEAFEPKPQNQNDVDFDQIGKSLAEQSKIKLEQEAEPAKSPASETPAADLPPSALPESEPSWAPVAAMGYTLLGEIIEYYSGMPELNYTPEEIEVLAIETEKIILTLWPDATGGLTEQQKTLLFSGSVIFKIHVDKYKTYIKLKEIQLEIEREKTKQAEIAAAAANGQNSSDKKAA